MRFDPSKEDEMKLRDEEEEEEDSSRKEAEGKDNAFTTAQKAGHPSNRSNVYPRLMV